MNMKLFLIVISSMFVGFNAFSQESESTRGQEAYDHYNYNKVIDLGKGKNKETASKFLSHLGDSYYFNGNYKEAVKWYEKLLNAYDDSKPEHYFRHAISLKSMHEYEKADAYMDTLLQVYPNYFLAEKYINKKDYYDQILNAPRRFQHLKNLNSNTSYSDFGSFVKDDEVYFASATPQRSIVKKRSLWTGKAFTELYSFNADMEEDSVEKIQISPNSTFNFSTPVITKDGNTMYYTRNVFRKPGEFNEKKSINVLKIYKAIKKDERWITEEELPFNSDQYSVAHPSLNEQENTLYFVSDMPGGLGETDIYSVNILENDEFGEPVNLGPVVNTSGRESFPFISAAGMLYFSSTGHVGLGGLDVFQVNINVDNATEKQVYHLGTQINSPFDDFAYTVNETSGSGYFSSNRPGGKGEDDIYSFERIKKLNCTNNILIKVIEDNGEPVKNASLHLIESEHPSNKISTNKEAEFNATISCEESLLFNVVAEGFKPREVFISRSQLSDKDELLVSLEPNERLSIKGQDLNSLMKLNKIYFELDKATIRPEAISSLDEIFMVMKEFPELKIEIGSHTDARASKEYNLDLSQRRAKATKAYLLNKGISENRLKAIGYGEKRLLNDCNGDSKCSEEEHQQNRRSEFRVIEE